VKRLLGNSIYEFNGDYNTVHKVLFERQKIAERNYLCYTDSMGFTRKLPVGVQSFEVWFGTEKEFLHE